MTSILFNHPQAEELGSSYDPRQIDAGQGIVIRRASSHEEILKAAELRYQIYVEERASDHPERIDLLGKIAQVETSPHLSDDDKLQQISRLKEAIETRRIVDAYDFLPTTVHYIALEIIGGSSQCVGHVRTLDRTNPLSADCPDFARTILQKTGNFREVSKLMIAKKYRGRSSGVLAGLFRFIFQDSKDVDDFYCSCLPSMRGLYEKISMVEVGPRDSVSIVGVNSTVVL